MDTDSMEVVQFSPLTTPDGRDSDHDCIVCMSKQPRTHMFEKIKIRTRPITEEGIRMFENRLVSIDWAWIHYLEVDDAVLHMNQQLQHVYHECFAEKIKIIKSSDPPWMNKTVKKLSEKKRKCFKRQEKSKRWKALDEKTKIETEKAKKSYVKKSKER